MKTSLICLLLLAAVTCAAPQAGEMPGVKRVGMTEKMKEKMAEKRKEIAEKMRERAEEIDEEKAVRRKEMAEKMSQMAEKKREEMAEEKQEESENAVAAAKSDVKAESRGYCDDLGPCYGPYGEVIGCFRDFCYYDFDTIFYDVYSGCPCCIEYDAPYSCF